MIDVIKVVFPAVLAFFVGMVITPFFTDFFYKYKLWKKSARVDAGDITNEHFSKIHNTSSELSTPRVGGVIIWVSTILTVLIIYVLSVLVPSDLTEKLNFLSRSQTLVPLAGLILGGLIGLSDDLLQIFGKGQYARDPLIYRKVKVLSIGTIGILVGLWFYHKLSVSSIHIPFNGEFDLGYFFVPFFILVMLGVFSASVIDGMDGLSGGVLGNIFTGYAIIAFANNQIDIATLCAVIGGGILAFLWFNIPPARFYMGETGMLALTVALSIIVFLTNSVLVLLIIGLPLVVTSLSVVIQIVGYKYFGGKRVFKVAPLHHHFEAIGWSREKIVMRYWVISVVCAISGVIVALVS